MADLELRVALREPGVFGVQLYGQGADVLALRRHIALHASREIESGSFLVPAGRITLLLASTAPFLQQNGGRLVRDEATEEILGGLVGDLDSLRAAIRHDLRPAEIGEIPNFQRRLTPEQRGAVRTILSLPHGANFSVPGAGKTAVALAVHEVLRAQGKVHRLLVVCPRNAFQPWEEEIGYCLGSGLRVVRATGGESRIISMLRSSNPADVLLVSYQQLAVSLDEFERFCARQNRLHIVLDESHKIKRARGGLWTDAVHKIGPLAVRRDILTGTPLPNGPVDLGSQLRFLWPYYTVIPEAELQSATGEKLIRERLRPLFVRVTKADLGLPPPRIIRQSISMGPLQARIHSAIVGQAVAAVSGLQLSDRAQFGRLRRQTLRMIQVASNPTLILHRADEFRLPPLDIGSETDLYRLFSQYADHEVPAKFLLAVERVKKRSREGKKTIVWTSFVHNLRMLANLLADFQPVVLYGGVPTALEGAEPEEGTREALISRFKKDPECRVMLANPAACGESISLHTVCDYALYLDRTFNAGHFLQSMDRIHRLGLSRAARVTYELLVTKGTIDEVVDQRLGLKVRKLANILDDRGLVKLVLDVDNPSEDEEFDREDAERVMAFLIHRQ
jgi:SNF2 family DNA or RNA helicase